MARALKRYRHYPITAATADDKAGQRERYKVTTINWTYGTVKGVTNHSLVHRNEYEFTLRGLIRFAVDLETMGVAETIIRIEPIELGDENEGGK